MPGRFAQASARAWESCDWRTGLFRQAPMTPLVCQAELLAFSGGTQHHNHTATEATGRSESPGRVHLVTFA